MGPDACQGCQVVQPARAIFTPVGLPPLVPGVSDGCSGIGPEAVRKHTQHNERQNRKRRYQNFHDLTSFA